MYIINEHERMYYQKEQKYIYERMLYSYYYQVLNALTNARKSNLIVKCYQTNIRTLI